MAGGLTDLAIALDATEAQLQFALLAGRFEDYQPVLAGSVLTTLREMEKLHFASEGSVFNDTWDPLKPATVRERIRLGYGGPHPILIREGTLAASLTGRHPDAVVTASRFSLLFGTKVDYAKYHQHLQENASRDKGIVPERQVIPDPLPVVVLDDIRQGIRDYLIEGRVRRAT